MIDEALIEAEMNFERYDEAELYRLKGELLQTADQTAAEGYFVQAINLARKQNAKMLELRALMSLCRLWQSQGKREQALKTLRAIYQWFSEGSETRDLQNAARLLQELTLKSS